MKDLILASLQMSVLIFTLSHWVSLAFRVANRWSIMSCMRLTCNVCALITLYRLSRQFIISLKLFDSTYKIRYDWNHIFGFNLWIKCLSLSQQWLLDPQELLITRMKDLQQYNLKEDEYYKLMMFFTNCKFVLFLTN